MSRPRHPPCTIAVAAVLAAAMSGVAVAGRPLSVDDAGTNAKGEGHVETWIARADGSTTVNVSPAFAFADGWEISALLARDTRNDLNGSAIQLKGLFTPSRESGCNAGGSVGAAHASGNGASASSRFLAGILSCNGTALGNVHLNLGTVKTTGQSAVGTWGVALEREFGSATPHAEWFGEKHAKPTFQVGARTDVAKTIQLDGTIGRSDSATLYSVGLKFRF